MFTGIIKELGKLTKIKKKTKDLEIEITCRNLLKDTEIGDSIAVNGCCLTVKNTTPKSFVCDISSTTLERTTFKYIKIGEVVNLENSLSLKDKIGGHLVSGHIDGVGKILRIEKIEDSYQFSIKVKTELFPYIVPQGSIAVDGISLTVSGVNKGPYRNESKNTGKEVFELAIIPYTFNHTNLKFKKEGDLVNIEVDLILRYLVSILKNYDFIKNNKGEINNETPQGFPASLFTIKNKNLNHNNLNQEEKDKLLKEMLTKYGFTQ